MKQAYRRTENCELQADSTEHEQKNARAANFLLPVMLVTAITIATGEILYGTLACLVFCAVLYLPQRKMTPGQFLDKVRSGFQDMIVEVQCHDIRPLIYIDRGLSSISLSDIPCGLKH